jgi:16S rRNA (uracil1498-N3)-methyltransferase
MAHFYLRDDLDDAEIGSSVSVSGAEARHAVSVSRLGVGDRISVGNGAGLVLDGVVVAAEPAEFVITVESVTRFPAATPAIWLAQALAKGDRDEQAVQQATELGVDGVIPWAAQRSIVKWEGNKVAKGVQRWAAIVREATKQSVRPWIPEVAELASGAVLAKLAAETRMIVLDPGAEAGLSELEPDGRDIVLVVGPEGGVSPAELSRLTAAGASAWNLGRNVLRTSTAGPAAIAVLNTRLGRW